MTHMYVIKLVYQTLMSFGYNTCIYDFQNNEEQEDMLLLLLV